MKYQELFNNVSNESFSKFSETAGQVIEKLMLDKATIIEMLENVLEDEELIKKSECYDFLDKIICFSDDDADIHMRISLFNDKYANRIHYHRWDYVACILSGAYTQYFYGLYNGQDISSLYPYEPIYIQHHLPNEIYSLNHSIIHSVVAQPDTISICIRGKAFEDRFQTINPITNTTWWQYGAKLEASEERQMKSVSKAYLNERIAYIIKVLRNQR